MESSSKTAGAPAASPEVLQQLDAITRQLHETLRQLGVMPKLQIAAEGLPHARSRLDYIAAKTSAAAERVLNSVDCAMADNAQIIEKSRRITAAIGTDPVKAVASESILDYVSDVEQTTARIDKHLTDIMMAQDFHDLTGQVVAKVVALASDLEDGLVRLLGQATPPDQAQKVGLDLQGPVVDAAGRTDVVANQREVDDLLASLGF